MESRQPMNLSVVEESISTTQYEDEIRDWVDLPSEIHGLIFSLLFYFDRIRFRLTCKAWQLAAIRHDSSSSSSSSSPCLDSPWLMFCSKPQSEGVYSFFNPISNETCTTKIPELAGAMVRCQRFGWLLMMRADEKRKYYKNSLFFYNPFIPGSTIEIPDFIYLEIASMYFTAPPTSSDCVVFACDVSIGDRVGIHKWGFGEDDWTEYNINCQATFKTSACPPVFYNDVFYQIDTNGRLGVLNPNNKDDQEFTLNDFPQPIPRNDIVSKYMKNYIAGCDGVLISVFVGRRGDSIHVLELNWSRMEWVPLQSLGNKAMFISEFGSLLIETKGEGAENKIYFTRFLNKKGGEYRQGQGGGGPATKRLGMYYCLKTCKYHASESSFSRGDWIGTRGVLNSIWIEPNLDFDAWLRFLEDQDDDIDDDDDDDEADEDDEAV